MKDYRLCSSFNCLDSIFSRIPIHYGCWQLTDEAMDRPVQDLHEALHAAQIPSETFEAAVVGKTYRFRPDSP